RSSSAAKIAVATTDRRRKQFFAHTLEATKIHQGRCRVPQAHDIRAETTTTVMYGPNSTLISLLGPPRCPRDVGRRIHHLTAWYHVPGRYRTTDKPLPAKRSQSRVNSGSSPRVVVAKGEVDEEASKAEHSVKFKERTVEIAAR
ncbi:uncharacterized protein LOC141902193, partial [Tubulanus polymorphus]|uniref:uncharacterized protein LOC141902193 n=1 Tax=Tubulanus polymorphus TaxID=672921 RepID=UPI003DA43986